VPGVGRNVITISVRSKVQRRADGGRMAWSGPTSGLGACSYTGRTTLEKGHSTEGAEQRSHRTKSYRKSDYCTSGRGLVLSRGPELGAVEADVGREKA